VRTPIGSSVSI